MKIPLRCYCGKALLSGVNKVLDCGLLELNTHLSLLSFFQEGSEGYRFNDTVEPRYNEVLGTMKITLLYQVSHYIRVTK